MREPVLPSSAHGDAVPLLKDLKLLARTYRSRAGLVIRPKWPGRTGHYRIHVRSRDDGFEADIRLRRDSSDLRTFQQIFLKRDYDLSGLARGPDIKRAYSSIAERGVPLILDLGANIGLASLYFAKAWPRARIVSVEPAPDNYRLLCENIAGHDAIQPVHAGIAATAGAVRIVNPEADAWAYRTASAAPGSQGAIPAVTVPELLKTAQCIPFIAKIDIEGFEQDFFAANTDWVSAFPVIVIELHDWMLPGSASSRSFLRTISQLNRDFVCRGENVFSIANANLARLNWAEFR